MGAISTEHVRHSETPLDEVQKCIQKAKRQSIQQSQQAVQAPITPQGTARAVILTVIRQSFQTLYVVHVHILTPFVKRVSMATFSH